MKYASTLQARACLRCNSHRFHSAEALRCAISRLNIDVFTPQTLWAVIRITVALHKSITMLTDEVLFPSLKLFTHLLRPQLR